MAERILVAEDQENLCRLIQTTLAEQGYEVAVALGGDAAIHELQAREFDLVVSDMRMPGASGAEVFRHARAQAYQPDVILMTAFGDAREAVQMMKDGAADYILKDNLLDELAYTRGLVDQRWPGLLKLSATFSTAVEITNRSAGSVLASRAEA